MNHSPASPPLALALLAGLTAPTTSQLRTHSVSPAYDSVAAPSVAFLPGAAGGFRKQILIDEPRLLGILGREIAALMVRRENSWGELHAGQVEMKVTMARAPRVAALAREPFAENRQGIPMEVFSGAVSIPHSPKPKPGHVDWKPENTVRINFTRPFVYTGGTLCMELTGRPIAGRKPDLWGLDAELASNYGSVVRLGSSCNPFRTVSGGSAFGRDLEMVIGSSMQLKAIGHHGSTPLILLGASGNPAGIDLAPLGAPGCRRHLDPLIAVPLIYYPASKRWPKYCGFTHFLAQIPPDPRLLGARLYAQFVDLETGLPRSRWTNAAGLTTSNGLALTIGATAPNLGMATVQSHSVAATQPMPNRGEVILVAAPVMRLLYR